MSSVAFGFNSIYIIESLRPEDRKTGTNLFNDLIRYRAEQYKLHAELIIIETKEEFFNELMNIKQNLIEKKILPYLHFEVHGSENGLQLRSLEMVYWKELYKYFVDINIILRNKLFISLATCYGAYMYKVIDIESRTPFFGYVGPTHKAYPSDLEKDFYNYFDTLFGTTNFDEAIAELNKTASETPYMLNTAEMLFGYLRDYLVPQLRDKAQKRAKFTELFKRSQEDPAFKRAGNRIQARKQLKSAIGQREDFLYAKRDYFLMKDL